MAELKDWKTLYQLMCTRPRGNTHAERMESFYGPQSQHYDAFRWRILHGREALFRALPVPEKAVWADFGGATGGNFEFVAERVSDLQAVHLLDLSPSLLGIARERAKARGWSQFHFHEADVTEAVLPDESCDVITFSYSLTMIPDWFKALDRAWAALKPGGIIGVVDFYEARKNVPPDLQQSWYRRSVLPLWFAFDGVNFSPDHGPYLDSRFERIRFEKHTARFPNTLIHVDHFHFIGRKPPV